MPQASDLEAGDYFICNGEPVRVVRKEVVAFGTHSHTKLKLFILGLNEKGERSINLHHKDKVEIIDITRKLGQVISKANNRIQIMDMVSYETLYSNVDGGLFNEIKEGDNVTFIDVNGNCHVIEKRA